MTPLLVRFEGVAIVDVSVSDEMLRAYEVTDADDEAIRFALHHSSWELAEIIDCEPYEPQGAA